MSKSSLLCSLVLVQFCILQLCLISSSWQLTAGQAALCGDRIGSRVPRFMSILGRDDDDREVLDGGGYSGDSIFDGEELADEGLDEYASDGGGGAPAEGEEAWMPDDDGGGGSGAKGSGGSGSGSGGGGDVECPECGKFFKNDKSMFGHLRSHPNRGYKGATPPVDNKLKLSPEPAAAAAAASPPPSSSPSRGTHHQPLPRRDRRLLLLELVSPYALLTLQCREENSDQATQLVPPPPAPAPPCFRNQTEGESSSMVAAEAHDDGYSCPVLKIPKKRRNMLKEIRDAHSRKKKANLVPPPPTPKERGPYICKHCPADFPTHQALGGHVAGHHSEKKVAPAQNDASSSRAQQGLAAQSQQDGNSKMQVESGGDDDDDGWRDSDDDLPLRRGLESEQVPMASDVPRRSRQAPGGQMMEMRLQHSGRRSDGRTLAAPPAPAPTRTEADDNRDGRRLLNIDLNADAAEQE